jgi:hypothetical protein
MTSVELVVLAPEQFRALKRELGLRKVNSRIEKPCRQKGELRPAEAA